MKVNGRETKETERHSENPVLSTGRSDETDGKRIKQPLRVRRVSRTDAVS